MVLVLYLNNFHLHFIYFFFYSTLRQGGRDINLQSRHTVSNFGAMSWSVPGQDAEPRTLATFNACAKILINYYYHYYSSSSSSRSNSISDETNYLFIIINYLLHFSFICNNLHLQLMVYIVGFFSLFDCFS